MLGCQRESVSSIGEKVIPMDVFQTTLVENEHSSMSQISDPHIT